MTEKLLTGTLSLNTTNKFNKLFSYILYHYRIFALLSYFLIPVLISTNTMMCSGYFLTMRP